MFWTINPEGYPYFNGYKWLYLRAAVPTRFHLFNHAAEAYFTPRSLKRKSRGGARPLICF